MTADSCGIQMGIINVMLDYELHIRKMLLLLYQFVRGAYEGKQYRPWVPTFKNIHDGRVKRQARSSRCVRP